MTPMLATLAQAHGATLVGLGVVDWLGRKADRQGVLALLAGNLVVQVLSLGLVLRTMSLGAGSAVAPGVVITWCWGAQMIDNPVRGRFNAKAATCAEIRRAQPSLAL